MALKRSGLNSSIRFIAATLDSVAIASIIGHHAAFNSPSHLHQQPSSPYSTESPAQSINHQLRSMLHLPPVNPATYKIKRFIMGNTTVLYRGPALLLVRFLVRMKVFQVAGFLAATAGLVAYISASGTIDHIFSLSLSLPPLPLSLSLLSPLLSLSPCTFFTLS